MFDQTFGLGLLLQKGTFGAAFALELGGGPSDIILGVEADVALQAVQD
jgi:hypothetical protein